MQKSIYMYTYKHSICIYERVHLYMYAYRPRDPLLVLG